MEPQVLAMCSSYSAQRLLIGALCITAFCTNGCIDAPHDNPYDPQNPNKAYLSVSVNELGSFDLQGATVKLIQNATTIQTDTTDEHGIVVFDHIDPGIYHVRTEATYYSAVEQGPETLWAAFEISRKVQMITLHFDDELSGISSPHHLSSTSGTWIIDEDHDQPEEHSTPNVYRGVDGDLEDIALSLCNTTTQSFLIEANLKVDATSSENWRAGVVFRYQDASNYRILLLSPTAVQCYTLIDGQINDIRIVERELNVEVWYTLTVGRNQNEGFMRIQLDNSNLFTLYDNIFYGGKVGLVVSNSGDSLPVIVSFDDVSIDLTYSYIQ